MNWHEAGENNLTARPLHELIHAEIEHDRQRLRAGRGEHRSRRRPSPEFIEFLQKLFAFRKRFEHYFNTYQHVLGFPDGQVDRWEGHIVDGSGFIVLVNPTEETRR